MTSICDWPAMTGASNLQRCIATGAAFTKGAAIVTLVTACIGCVDPKQRQRDLNPGFNPYQYGAVVPREELPPHKWTKFVAVAGQPEPVPAEWLSTPEGQYAHSIVLPDPLPKDSGYKWTMSSTDYFLHLCEKEAGEFIYRKVESVEGILFLRPLFQATDQDLQDRYKLEAPGLLSGYQLWGIRFSMRAVPFLKYRDKGYDFYVEPKEAAGNAGEPEYWQARERDPRSLEVGSVQPVSVPGTPYAVSWRGVIRKGARERSIGAEEILVMDMRSNEVLGLMRRFFLTGRTARTPQGVWWLNAARCPQFEKRDPVAGHEHLKVFVESVLVPKKVRESEGAAR
jgi:hypothetical protein